MSDSDDKRPCADCGREVERTPWDCPPWGIHRDHGGWQLTCRIRTLGDRHFVADWHHVDGEEQLHQEIHQESGG